MAQHFANLKQRYGRLVEFLKEIVPNLQQRVHRFVRRRVLGDSLALVSHYYGIIGYLTMFTIVQLNLIMDGDLYCVDQSSGEVLPEEMEHVCRSHHYGVGSFDAQGKKEVSSVFLFFPWLLLLLGGIHCFVFIAVRVAEHTRVRLLMDKKYQNSPENIDIRHECSLFIQHNLGSFSSVYFTSLALHVCVAAVDFACLYFVNALTSNRIIKFISMYPNWDRDVVGFTDQMSLAFPPFVTCEINPTVQILALKTVTYGCYNKMAELYEKMTIVMVVYSGLLLVATIAHVLYMLFIIPTCWVKRSLLSTGGALPRSEKRIMTWASVGDVMVAHYLKKEVTGRGYCKAIAAIGSRPVNCPVEVLGRVVVE